VGDVLMRQPLVVALQGEPIGVPAPPTGPTGSGAKEGGVLADASRPLQRLSGVVPMTPVDRPVSARLHGEAAVGLLPHRLESTSAAL